jgi:hypothetical protein
LRAVAAGLIVRWADDGRRRSGQSSAHSAKMRRHC